MRAPYGGGAMIPRGADPLDTKLAGMQRAAQARLEAHAVEEGRLHDQVGVGGWELAARSEGSDSEGNQKLFAPE